MAKSQIKKKIIKPDAPVEIQESFAAEDLGRREVAFNVLDFVNGGITDRDAPTLYGATPGRSLTELYDEKINLGDCGVDINTEDGLLAEVRAIFAGKIAAKAPVVFRHAFLENKAMPYLRAVVDGVDFSIGLVLRIVAHDQELFDRVADHALPERGGKVPERNWIEIQHQLAVTGLEKAYFVSVLNGVDGIHSTPVRKDAVFCSNHVAECIQFWDRVRRAEYPPAADPNQTELPIEEGGAHV